MKNNLQEISVSFVLILLLLLFLNPLHFWMPDALLMMMILGLIVVFTIFVSFIWKETVSDEREELHRTKADRSAFLVGSGVLTLGIIIESLQHNNDPWLIIALGAMIMGKVVGLIFNKFRN